MRLLVTGARGYIGGRLVARLARDHQLFTIGRTPPSSTAPNVVHIARDLHDATFPAALPARIDGVVHLAQSPAYRNFPAAACDMTSVSVMAAVRLAEYAAGAGASRFCLVSSGSVYEPYATRLTEEEPLTPAGFNGAAKLAAELLVRPFAACFPVFMPRLFCPYGPGQSDRLVVNLIDRVLCGETIEVDADGGGPWLAPIYIDDVIDILATGVEEAWNGPLNVAGPDALTLMEIGQLIGSLANRQPFIRFVRRPPQRIVPDLTRLAALHPLATLTPFRTGLRLTMGLASDRGGSP